jgi:Zn-finger nucleic acid-binding protein
MPDETLKSTRPAGRRELRVGPGLLEARFRSDCDTRRCEGACCRKGVWLDPGERDTILAHADLVREAMDPGQPRAPRQWFSRRVIADPDFPSGRAVHTRVRKGQCVFLNGAGRCVLQKASSTGRGALKLKPFFCTAYPVTIVDGVLMLDDEDYRSQPACCGSSPAGRLTVFETCDMELRHVLGAAGVERLRRIAARRERARRPPR